MNPKQERKTLKGYRKIPTIYGLNAVGFLITFFIFIGCLLSLLGGISFAKLLLTVFATGTSYLICLVLASNEKVKEFLYDEKLPEKFSDD